MIIQFPNRQVMSFNNSVVNNAFNAMEHEAYASQEDDFEVITKDTKEKEIEALSLESCDFNKIITMAENIQSQCSDHIISKVTPDTFFMNDEAGITYLTDDGCEMNSGISRYAVGQLGTKIGVPGQYIQKCIDSGRISLAQDNINSWVKSYKGGFFVRHYKESIRGILSPRYSVYDTPDILNMIADKVDMSNYEVKGNFLNEERLHLRMTSMDMLNIEGEDLFPGIFIDTSDVGRSNLTITFGIYKFVCTNGLVIGKGGTLYKQKHIGIEPREFEYQIAASIEKIPILIANAEEFVKKAKGKSMDMEKMQSIMKNMHLNDKAQEQVYQLMAERYDESKWGFINGITEVAQNYTLEKRLEIERLAGNVLVAA